MTDSEAKLSLWSETLKADDFNRTEETIAQQQFERYLHSIMHRPNQQNDHEF